MHDGVYFPVKTVVIPMEFVEIKADVVKIKDLTLAQSTRTKVARNAIRHLASNER